MIAGFIEAAQQALSGAPSVLSAVPAFAKSQTWNYVPLALLTIAGAFWLLNQFQTVRPNNPQIDQTPQGGLSAMTAANFNRTHRLELFRLGQALASIKRGDSAALSDLFNRCENLGLSYSAAKINRILEVVAVDRAGAEEIGVMDFSESDKMFDFQMKDMEDAIVTELERIA